MGGSGQEPLETETEYEANEDVDVSVNGPVNSLSQSVEKHHRKAFKRSANAVRRTTPYGHVEKSDVRNLKGMIKRRHDLIKKKMDDLYKICGIPSLFILASEVPYLDAIFHTYTAPSGAKVRPLIQQQTIDTIGKSLSDTLKHHLSNHDYVNDNYMILITTNDSIQILKKYLKNDEVPEEFKDMEMFFGSLKKKVSSEELFAMVSVFNKANKMIRLANPTETYSKQTVVAYSVLMLTILNLEDLNF